MAQTEMPQVYRENLKQNPLMPIVRVYCTGKPEPMTLGEGVELIKTKYWESFPDWRKRAVLDTMSIFKDLTNKQIGKISFRDLDSVLSKSTQHISSNVTNLSRFIAIFRILVDKQIPESVPRVFIKNEEPSSNGNEEVKIKHQLISNDEAMALINNSRGRNPLFRMNLLGQLRAAIETNQSYAFTPLNLPGNPVERKKDLIFLKQSVYKTIKENNLAMSCYYIESRNLFVVTNKPQLKEKTNASIKK